MRTSSADRRRHTAVTQPSSLAPNVVRIPPADPLRNLGVHLTSRGGELRVWSEHATSIDLCIFDGKDPAWVAKTVPLARDEHSVWSATTRSLTAGTYYALRAKGPK